MAETSNKTENNISIANLRAIGSFEASCRASITSKLDDQKRRIEGAFATLNEKRAKIEAEEQAKREKQQERERLEKERDAELRASIASFEDVTPATQIDEKKPEVKDVEPAEKVAEVKEEPKSVEAKAIKTARKKKNDVLEEKVAAPAEQQQTTPVAAAQIASGTEVKKEEISASQPVEDVKPIAKAEPAKSPVKDGAKATTAAKQPAKPSAKINVTEAIKPIATKAPAKAEAPKEEPHVETEAERRRKEQASAITNSILAKPKKAPAEKPVIRIYVPTPTPDTRSERRPRQQGANGTSFKSGFGGQGKSAPRTQGGKPILMPPMPMSMPGGTNSKKRGVPQKGHTQIDDSEDKNPKKNARSRYAGAATIEYDETGEITRIRTRKTSSDKRKNTFVVQPQTVIDHAILDSDTITIKALSEKIGKTGVEIIKQLFLLGIIKTINDTIDFDTADLVAGELGVTLELQKVETSEEKVMAAHDDMEDDPKDLVTRPPIVTIMGHVDHGKTSILDYIRSANVAGGEAGGITQHIGAYSISVKGQQITFLDTPGHAAFTAMRARGANCTDIAIIVVAADDGIMPQTIEAINHAKAAGVQIIVAINKMDKPTADPDRVMTALTEYELIPEEWGGSVPVCKVSAKTGAGIKELLETILINAEVMELKANPKRLAKGVVIEAKLDKGKGPMATILVQNGTLRVSDYLVAGSVTGKVRAMQDDKGRPVKSAGPSMAVSVLGLQDVPDAGDQLLVVEDEKLMKEVATLRAEREKEKRMNSQKLSLDDVFKNISDGKLQNLNLIIKADVQGSVEAIRESMLKLSNDEVKVNVVHAVAGAINESDVMLADTTNSIIIGFNVRMDSNAKAIAEKSNIDVRLYRVIYDAIDDVTAAIKGLLAPKFREQYLGKAEIRVVYKISGVGSIAGCMVKDGKIVRNAKARVIRDNIVVKETGIASLKRMKDDVKEVVAGYECGIGLLDFNDIKEGDIIESFSLVQEEI